MDSPTGYVRIDPVHKIDLPAVLGVVIDKYEKGFLGGIHVQSHNPTDKLTQRLVAVLIFVALLRDLMKTVMDRSEQKEEIFPALAQLQKMKPGVDQRQVS